MVWNQGTSKGSVSSYVVASEDEYESFPGSYSLIGFYDRPLPCGGCGIGWFSFILGFVFPLAWYCGAFLYLTNYYEYDPRERSGLAASAIIALVFTVVLLIVILVVMQK